MIHLLGAYGRSYKTFEEAKADWQAGKDFKIWGGPYTSIRDENKLLDYYDEIQVIIGKGESFVLNARKKDLIDEVLGK